ncbi:flavodoxin family protein [Clostridium sp. P21]|uniref:Flavodoxin family protein n=1 Tax=Clostridium muellerianum TaxID=2716538 RepID=A0A7Y0EM16_9CLOT|nr:flavodoxin family protein [Clostridium muellerianum]
MKVLGINGSSRKDGNTALIMKIVFEELEKEGIETEMVQFSRKLNHVKVALPVKEKKK